MYERLFDTRIGFADTDYYGSITSVKLYSVEGEVINEMKTLSEEWPGGYDYFDPGVGQRKSIDFSPYLFPQSKTYQIVIKANGYKDLVLTIVGPVGA
ncbi:hemoblobin-interacting domain-containing protein [Brevibacillus reuszeri]|uniref:hemoblobin-interacting domain-containing protein n=1 Tax=Brevibacillus reuszeri TaxID=54915 RepID=UPI001BB35778|nr:hemoblobin-interacting domain-containing protein [Brevibacillus reuszeri]